MTIQVYDAVRVLDKERVPYELWAKKSTVLSGPIALDVFTGKGMTFYTGNDSKRINKWVDPEDGLIICSESHRKKLNSGPFLFVEKVRLAFILCARLFVPPKKAGIHPTAIIDPKAIIGCGVGIGPFSVVGAAEIGDNTFIGSLVSITDNVRIGNAVTIMNGVHLGDPGLGCEMDRNGRQVLFPHFESVVIENDVVIGAGTIIQRGGLVPTIIGKGTIISSKCIIAHNCIIGNNVFISAGSVVGGSVRVGNRSFLGLGCCIRDKVEIADYVTIGMNSTVTKSCFKQGVTIMGKPAIAIGQMFGVSRK